MPLDIEGTKCYPASEAAAEVGVSRQTLWRWRRQGKIPLGHRFRDGQVVFTEPEFEAVKQHAYRIEPLSEDVKNQLNLFGNTA